ncbi:uncharacterized protein V6R79_006980 [Siganus canaliculatus]
MPREVRFCLKMVWGPGLRIWLCRAGRSTGYRARCRVSHAPLDLKLLLPGHIPGKSNSDCRGSKARLSLPLSPRRGLHPSLSLSCDPQGGCQHLHRPLTLLVLNPLIYLYYVKELEV